MTTDESATDESGTDDSANGAAEQPSIQTPARVAIRTSDGFDLRAEVAMPAAPSMLAVLCHPHPCTAAR
ncbi:MAG: hypothetical protein R2706_07910 [Acidimicrobiales bacterium]